MSDYWPSDEDDFEVLDGNPMEKAHGATSLVGMGSDHIAAELGEDLIRLDEEIASIDEQIANLRTLRATLAAERKGLANNYAASKKAESSHSNQNVLSDQKFGPTKTKGIDYLNSEEPFEWSGQLRRIMREIWGIDAFRLCQEGVCNANMDGRDILCVMPTGGGKSLCYQLPALLSPGTTVVISPLISLIADQVMHLREKKVECVMLTGTTTKEQQNEAFARMTEEPKGRARPAIKLCYVTPEKVAKSKRFVSVLQKLASCGRLCRIVIDEAHCCSAMGHDFRPDYKKLSILKTLFPQVPILAVTATLSQKVLPDLLKILRLPPVTDGRAANAKGTCVFSSPLYRKNLHYKVLPKPVNAKAAIEEMAKYIVENHLNDSGIVYCLSRKDAEVVAQGLSDASGRAIKTGVYHADIGDAAKEQVHRDWKRGKIHCVTATTAFGLGIDKAETRYVLHAAMSKSMDGYYQETGRAGRDGKDADCILYYRLQDASRISSLTVGEMDGQSKVHDMLRYAQDVVTCRKLAFAEYFSTSASLSANAWEENGTGSTQACGHCDNCLRGSNDRDTLDVTVDVWKLLKVMEEVDHSGGRITLSALAELARGLGGGSFAIANAPKRGKGKVVDDKGFLDVAKLCGAKVALNKDRTETLALDMILRGYLEEDYHANAYAVNVYVKLGRQSTRFTRLTMDQVDAGQLPLTYNYTFSGSGTRKSVAAAGTGTSAKPRAQPKSRNAVTSGSKGGKESSPPAKKRKTAPIASSTSRSKKREREPSVPTDIEELAMREELEAIHTDDYPSEDSEGETRGWTEGFRV